jgi:hypothetical protein
MPCARRAYRNKQSRRRMSSSRTRVDLERDGLFLVTHGLDRDQLMDRMGGSP